MKDNSFIYALLFIIFILCTVNLIFLTTNSILLIDRNTKECYGVKYFNTIYKIDMEEALKEDFTFCDNIDDCKLKEEKTAYTIKENSKTFKTHITKYGYYEFNIPDNTLIGGRDIRLTQQQLWFYLNMCGKYGIENINKLIYDNQGKSTEENLVKDMRKYHPEKR